MTTGAANFEAARAGGARAIARWDNRGILRGRRRKARGVWIGVCVVIHLLPDSHSIVWKLVHEKQLAKSHIIGGLSAYPQAIWSNPLGQSAVGVVYIFTDYRLRAIQALRRVAHLPLRSDAVHARQPSCNILLATQSVLTSRREMRVRQPRLHRRTRSSHK